VYKRHLETSFKYRMIDTSTSSFVVYYAYGAVLLPRQQRYFFAFVGFTVCRITQEVVDEF